MSAELDALRVVRACCDSPGVHGTNKASEMAGVAASIVEMTGEVRSNKEAFSNIGKNACEIVANVIKRSMPEHSMINNSKMEVLQANLRDIRDRVKKHVQRRGLVKRILDRIFSEVKTIRECHNRLQNCYDILGLRYIEETLDSVETLTRQVQELLEHQRQKSPAQASIAPNASLDSSIDMLHSNEGLTPATEERSTVTREGVDNPMNHQAVDTVSATGSRLPEESLSLIRGDRTDAGSNSVSHAHFAGNAVSSTMGTVINVRGSGNRFRITLRA